MKIATWNVNGIRARQSDVLQWVAAEQPDVICLQEIKASAPQIPASLCEMNGYWCYWHGAPKGYSGVSLHLLKETFPEPPVFSHPDFDFENRIVIATAGVLRIGSVYVPNGGKDFAAKLHFMEALLAFSKESQRSGGQLLLCGDMNIARADIDVHPKERRPVIGQLPEERVLFERFLDTGLTDIGRTLDPENDSLFTWWAPWRNMKQRNIGWRLDYVLASPALAERARSCTVAREVGTSDHAPVIAEFT